MEVEKQYYTVQDIMKIIGCSRCTAYSIIKKCNEELKELGKITINGKVNIKYFHSKIEV